MLKYLKALFVRKETKPVYTICVHCQHYNAGILDYGIVIPDECYSFAATENHLNFITGKKYLKYNGKAELCNEKNTGHCPDFKKKRSFFDFRKN